LVKFLVFKMVKLSHLIVLGSGLAVTAFSLEGVAAKHSAQKLSSLPSRKTALPIKHSMPSYLQCAEGTASPESNDNVVAAATPVKEAPKKSFKELFWNDSTKLTVYLAVWYLGNIYCEFF
jgi:hypothetical protein